MESLSDLALAGAQPGAAECGFEVPPAAIAWIGEVSANEIGSPDQEARGKDDDGDSDSVSCSERGNGGGKTYEEAEDRLGEIGPPTQPAGAAAPIRKRPADCGGDDPHREPDSVRAEETDHEEPSQPGSDSRSFRVGRFW
jgi:hypothetical protein